MNPKQFWVLPGHVLVAPDPDETMYGRIHYSERMHKKTVHGLCVQHVPMWLDEDLTGLRIFFEKWSWRQVTLRGVEFYIVPEQAVFGVLEQA